VKQTGVKILLIGLTALGLSAGVVAGMLVSRLPAATAGAGERPASVSAIASPLAELDLTPDQQQQMQKIWEGVRKDVQGCFDQAQSLQKQRDDAIVSLLSEEQKAKFAEISKQFHDRDVKITGDRQRLLGSAIEQTKQLLNDEQRKKYEQILQNRLGKIPTTGPVAEVFTVDDATGFAREHEVLGGVHD